MNDREYIVRVAYLFRQLQESALGKNGLFSPETQAWVKLWSTIHGKDTPPPYTE